MRKLIRYHMLQYSKTNKWILPGLVLLSILSLMYSVKPVGLTDSISLSATILFFLMVWIGYGCNIMEDPVSEQIMILRVQSERKYYISQLLFVSEIGVTVSLITLIFPLVQYGLNGSTMFDRTIGYDDICCWIIVMVLYAVTGGMMGAMTHERVMKSSQFAIMTISLLVILTIARGGIVHQLPAMKAVLWIVPPVLEATSWFGTTEQMTWSGTLLTAFTFFIYSIGYAVIRIEIMVRHKF